MFGQAYSYPFSAWCAAVGDNFDYYENNMNAWMTYDYFIYVGDYVNAQLSFWIWYNIEDGHDYFQYKYSYDNTNWFTLDSIHTGYSGGWINIFHNIPDYVDYYYMHFKFTSDEIVTLEGVYVDDIIITGEIPPKLPNLTYDTPPWWDDALILSHDTGNHVNNELYSGSDTYIDFAIINNGDTTAPLSITRVYIDDLMMGQFWAVSLDPLEFDSTILDEPYEFTMGQHTVKMVIDYFNYVIEDDETDNVIEVTEYWEFPEISVEGEVWYQIPFYPYWSTARNFRVELWDADINDVGEMLDSGSTDSYGTFQLGPVYNFEENNSRQDIYIRVYAENSESIVGDSITLLYDIIPFYISSDTVWNVPSGTYRWIPPFNAPIEANIDESGFFYIANIIKEGYNFWMNLRPNDDPGITEVILLPNLPNHTYYTYVYDFIAIEAAAILGTWFPDTFDKDVILHEFGHRLHFTQGFFDDTAQGPLTHNNHYIFT